MRKILFVFLLSLILSSCRWIGNSNDFIVTRIEYSQSGDYRVYILGEGRKEPAYFYTTKRYRIGDTLTIDTKR